MPWAEMMKKGNITTIFRINRATAFFLPRKRPAKVAKFCCMTTCSFVFLDLPVTAKNGARVESSNVPCCFQHAVNTRNIDRSSKVRLSAYRKSSSPSGKVAAIDAKLTLELLLFWSGRRARLCLLRNGRLFLRFDIIGFQLRQKHIRLFNGNHTFCKKRQNIFTCDAIFRSGYNDTKEAKCHFFLRDGGTNCRCSHWIDRGHVFSCLIIASLVCIIILVTVFIKKSRATPAPLTGLLLQLSGLLPVIGTIGDFFSFILTGCCFFLIRFGAVLHNFRRARLICRARPAPVLTSVFNHARLFVVVASLKKPREKQASFDNAGGFFFTPLKLARQPLSTSFSLRRNLRNSVSFSRRFAVYFPRLQQMLNTQWENRL